MNLDDIHEMKKVDTRKMLDIIEKFPEQIEEGITIGKDAKINFSFNGKNVVIAGMGGSAISGEIITSLTKDECALPIFIVRDYSLPSFVTKETLFIALSYSGNTEETLSCFLQATQRGCNTISISSGGKLEKMTTDRCLIKIPPDMQPRAAVAYLLFPLITVLQRLGVVNEYDFDETIKKAKMVRKSIKQDFPTKNNEAKQLATKIKGTPIIYASDFLSPIARRWRQQFNENAKMMAFDFSLPEANHNEIMAWEYEIRGDYTCIFLRHKNEDEKIKKRFDFMKKAYDKKAHIIEVFSDGKDKLAQLIHSLYLGDYVSTYLALAREIDPTPVYLIQQLKKEIE